MTEHEIDVRAEECEVRPPDEGATTAEYAITTLAACGFGALLVVILKSDPIRTAVESIITTALSLGG